MHSFSVFLWVVTRAVFDTDSMWSMLSFFHWSAVEFDAVHKKEYTTCNLNITYLWGHRLLYFKNSCLRTEQAIMNISHVYHCLWSLLGYTSAFLYLQICESIGDHGLHNNLLSYMHMNVSIRRPKLKNKMKVFHFTAELSEVITLVDHCILDAKSLSWIVWYWIDFLQKKDEYFTERDYIRSRWYRGTVGNIVALHIQGLGSLLTLSDYCLCSISHIFHVLIWVSSKNSAFLPPTQS